MHLPSWRRLFAGAAAPDAANRQTPHKITLSVRAPVLQLSYFSARPSSFSTLVFRDLHLPQFFMVFFLILFRSRACFHTRRQSFSCSRNTSVAPTVVAVTSSVFGPHSPTIVFFDLALLTIVFSKRCFYRVLFPIGDALGRV